MCATEFDMMGAASTKYNETPEKDTGDANRDGFVTAGGGAVVVVG